MKSIKYFIIILLIMVYIEELIIIDVVDVLLLELVINYIDFRNKVYEVINDNILLFLDNFYDVVKVLVGS